MLLWAGFCPLPQGTHLLFPLGVLPGLYPGAANIRPLWACRGHGPHLQGHSCVDSVATMSLAHEHFGCCSPPLRSQTWLLALRRTVNVQTLPWRSRWPSPGSVFGREGAQIQPLGTRPIIALRNAGLGCHKNGGVR